jgi:hypothetical protein
MDPIPVSIEGGDEVEEEWLVQISSTAYIRKNVDYCNYLNRSRPLALALVFCTILVQR